MKVLAALTIFLGSCLLFLVQPMIGNLLLPFFGGTAGVWVVCLCSFQALLVLGYLYAHVVGEWAGACSPWRWIHPVLLVGAAGVLHFSGGIVPSVIAVAVLYTVVGANAALVQRLMASDRATYRLYALSNVGSFVGLLVFPFAVEPLLPTSVQLRAYAGGVWAYAVLLGVLMACVVRRTDGGGPARSVFGVMSGIGWKEAFPWFCLSAVSCLVLDGLTAHLCNDVAPLPLLWCGLLAIYLLAWSLAFNETGARIGRWCGPAILVCLLLQILHYNVSGGIDYVFELVVGAAMLLFGCWHVHALLYHRRPDVSKLTGYYFVIALGGAAGGLIATLAVPMAFCFVAEYPIAQIALLGVVLWDGLARFRAMKGVVADTSSAGEFVRSPRMSYAVAGAFALSALFMWRLSQGSSGYLLARARNFYGTTRIASYNPGGCCSPISTGRTGPCS